MIISIKIYNLFQTVATLCNGFYMLKTQLSDYHYKNYELKTLFVVLYFKNVGV